MSSFIGLVQILVVVTIQHLLLLSVSSFNVTNEYLHHKCINSQGKYNKGSAYEDNLNRVIRLTSSDILRSGFSYTSYGKAPNAAYVLLQCRADSYLSKCRSCFDVAFSGLSKRCPGNKEAIIWYDQCLVKISTVRDYGNIDTKNTFYLSNPNKVSGNLGLFNKEASTLLKELTSKATSKDNVDGVVMRLEAAGSKPFGTKKLYGMVQCTQDLEFDGCNECLEGILKKFPNCCNGKQGGRGISTSCNFRYELYPFLRT
ncbi:unnamed protein product [Cochlearia groenlandica]